MGNLSAFFLTIFKRHKKINTSEVFLIFYFLFFEFDSFKWYKFEKSFYGFWLKRLKEVMENQSSMEIPLPSMINGNDVFHSQVRVFVCLLWYLLLLSLGFPFESNGEKFYCSKCTNPNLCLTLECQMNSFQFWEFTNLTIFGDLGG